MADYFHNDTGVAPSEQHIRSMDRTAEEELRARVRQQEATGRLGLAALSGMTLPDLMDEAMDVVAEVLAVEYCKILELMPEGTALLLRAGVGWEEGLVGTTMVGTNLQSQAGYALISTGPVVVEDLRTENRFEDAALLREHGVVSGLSMTIHVNGRPYGVLSAHTKKRRLFTEDEILFLQEVAEVLGAAIERKRAERDKESLLGERTEWAAAAERRFSFLAEANALLSASTDYRTVLTTAARLTVPAIADWCFVDVVEEAEGSVARFAVAHSDPEDGALAHAIQSTYRLDPSRPHGTARVYRTGAPESIPDLDEEVLREIAVGDPEHLDILRRINPGSYMCVPLRIGSHTLGAMGLISARSGRRYGADDVALAEGLAHCAALALNNARHQASEIELVRELVLRTREGQQVISPSREGAPQITPRQMEVLRMLSSGLSTREIGRKLYLSEATVRNHIRGLLQAFGAHSQLEVLARARELGVLT
jgi:GAF domain-containing protein